MIETESELPCNGMILELMLVSLQLKRFTLLSSILSLTTEPKWTFEMLKTTHLLCTTFSDTWSSSEESTLVIKALTSSVAFGLGKLFWVDCDIKAIGAYIRHRGHSRVLVISNTADTPVTARLQLPRKFIVPGYPQLREILTDAIYTMDSNRVLTVTMTPYQFLWVNLSPDFLGAL